MRRALMVGYLGAVVLMLAPALSQGGGACALPDHCAQDVVAPHCCCCGPACTCCKVSSPPATPPPTDGKAPWLHMPPEVSVAAGLLVAAAPAEEASVAVQSRIRAPGERPVYFLTRHLRN